MNNDVNPIKTMFDELQIQNPDVNIMHDGILDEQKYKNAKIKILWILKQEYYDSGALENTYVDRIKKCVSDEKVASSSTWRRMSYVSYGLLSGKREFNTLPDANICADNFLETAVIEVNKELGNSNSPDQVILDGFNRYKDLIILQLGTYKPDVIIVCLPNSLRSIVDFLYNKCHGSDFINGPKNIYIEGADVGIGKDHKPLFLWAYHPQATKGCNSEGISDDSYTMSLLQAYDNASQNNILA